MLHFLVRLSALITSFALFEPADRVHAQTYPIDCAILICLSGGWPASEPCARARAEFIRRITPWPVEPPLQIWRCPMGVSHQSDHSGGVAGRMYDILFDDAQRRWRKQIEFAPLEWINMPQPAFLRRSGVERGQLQGDLALQLAQDRADLDISGPEFDFVRSIRVFDVRIASQRLAGENDECRRFALVYLGTYGVQGEFTWQLSSPLAVPVAHLGLEGWGEECPEISNRSVFVDWRDYEGNYGFEQVNY